MRKMILALLFQGILFSLHSQEFNATVSSDSVLLGNYIILSYTTENLDGKFEAPDFDEMQIISGPNVSSSIQIINGDKSSKKTYSYHVQPGDVGRYTISPAYLITDAETVSTEPFVVNVYPNPEQIIKAPRQPENSIFEFRDYSPFGRREAPAPTPPSTPKRKYKKI